MTKSYNCIGLMSGTSMDGVDLVHCTFEKDEQSNWSFTINASQCMPYPPVWQSRLQNLTYQSAEVFAKTNVYYGHFLGKYVRSFMHEHGLESSTRFISSHGQTIFHNPSKGYTIQIGHGAALAKECSKPVVCDLRTADMAHLGQGAPIVPLGEQFLFSDFKQFINIGGISNVSIHTDDELLGYDVCMGNLLLDAIVQTIGKPFDNDGEMARTGTINKELLQKLNNHAYLSKKPPKSLDATEVLNAFLPMVKQSGLSIENQLATVVEHIALQLAQHLDDKKEVLITGGGAMNGYLMERLQRHFSNEVTVPNQQIIEYKEAVIIAFLGLKRLLNQPNVFANVTGAQKDTINGAVYLP